MKAEIFNFSQWVNETNPYKLQTDFRKRLDKAGFEIVGFIEHHFEPQGYTCLWLLGESHFAIHTFPEHGRSYIELSSCHKGKHIEFIDDLEKEIGDIAGGISEAN